VQEWGERISMTSFGLPGFCESGLSMTRLGELLSSFTI